MTTNSLSMQALVLENFASLFQLKKVSRPEPANEEVLVRIHTSGINPLDLKIKSGSAAHARTLLPAILGIDMAGVVVAIGANVKNFKIGDEVYGMTGGVGGVQGSLAEYAAVDANLLAIKPHNLSMHQAAAIPLVFITAWEGLVDRARVHKGQNVLIHGGTGGVGNMAVQIARAFDANVFATESGKQKTIIEGNGATAINYTTTSVAEYVKEYTSGEGFDIVYDTVGGTTLDASFAAVKSYTGHVLSCLGWGNHSLAPLSFRGATYSGVFTLMPLLTGKGRLHHGEILKEATKLAEAGKLIPLVDERSFTMETIEEAYKVIETRLASGKVVVDLC